MKICVTGAGGFIGSHLCEGLVESGFDVVALCHYNSSGGFGWLDSSSYGSEMQRILGDVRDESFMRSLLNDCDVVYHLAALIAIPYSYIAPSSYFDTNVSGTVSVLNAVLANEGCRLVQMSTSEVYGTAQYVPIDEVHPLVAQSPYSASKIGADAAVVSYSKSLGLQSVIARPFNTFGPRQSARAIIPTVIEQILCNEGVIRVGSVTPTRSFNFVKQTVKGLVALTQLEDWSGEVFNIGVAEHYSVLETIERLKTIAGVDWQIISDDVRLRPSKSEVQTLSCDSSKLQKNLRINLEDRFDQGLRETFQWFQEHRFQVSSASRSGYKI